MPGLCFLDTHRSATKYPNLGADAPFVLQFWQWGMLVMIGGLSLAIFYRRFKAYLK